MIFVTFIIAELREAGAVLLGKTGLHELAYGIFLQQPALRHYPQPA